MRIRLLLAACFMWGCSGVSPYDLSSDAGAQEDTGPRLELVCGPGFCGNISDRNTGATAHCGDCLPGMTCGDNNVPHVCGNACLPLLNQDPATYGTYNTAACDYYYGPNWSQGYGTEQQYSSTCNYIDQTSCNSITLWAPPGTPCTICGAWWCCVNNPDAGFNALLPNAVATDDGGLP